MSETACIINDSGIYPNVLMEDYVKDPCVTPSLSTGIISALLSECPRIAWQKHPRLNPNWKHDNNSATDIGSLAHAVLLKQNHNVEIIMADDWRTKAAKEQRDKAYEEGKIPLLSKDAKRVREMTAVSKAKLASLGLNNPTIESTVIWHEDETWCRNRPDLVDHTLEIILDYKTTAMSANPSAATKFLFNNGYDIQGTWMQRGIEAITGKRYQVIFLVQECREPYLCSLVGLSEAFTDFANRRINEAVGIWRKCLDADDWPGYPEGVAMVSPEAWQVSAWENKQFEMGLAEQGSDPTEAW